MCIDIINTFFCFKNKKYNKLSEKSKIINNTTQETTYTPIRPDIPDTIEDEYEQILTIDIYDEEYILKPKR